MGWVLWWVGKKRRVGKRRRRRRRWRPPTRARQPRGPESAGGVHWPWGAWAARRGEGAVQRKKCRVGKKSQGRQESRVGADDDGDEATPRWFLWVSEGHLGREQSTVRPRVCFVWSRAHF